MLMTWISLVSAQESPPIKPGVYEGGDRSNNDPFYVCLNVSEDGQRLTAINTQCRGNQGQNQNSIDVQFQGGQTPSGERCNQYSYRNLEFGDISIIDNSFDTTFENNWVSTKIQGTFDPANEIVTGTARTNNGFIDCTVQWEARPGLLSGPPQPPSL